MFKVPLEFQLSLDQDPSTDSERVKWWRRHSTRCDHFVAVEMNNIRSTPSFGSVSHGKIAALQECCKLDVEETYG